MEKLATQELINPKNGYSSEIKFEAFGIYQYDTKLNKASYKTLLPKLRDQAIFSNLCDMVENSSWNSFQYANLMEICITIGESTTTRLSSTLKKFEQLGLLKREDFKHTKRIYINPTYYCCTTKIKDFTLNLFNCNDIKKAVPSNEQGKD